MDKYSSRKLIEDALKAFNASRRVDVNSTNTAVKSIIEACYPRTSSINDNKVIFNDLKSEYWLGVLLQSQRDTVTISSLSELSQKMCNASPYIKSHFLGVANRIKLLDALSADHTHPELQAA